MTATSSAPTSYLTAANQMVSAANGIDYAYREVGDGTPPLVLLQHFRGNLDNWDRALIDALASARQVVTFDNVGVGGSSGTTPSTVAQMACDAVAFLEAMELDQVDLLGFSIGSFVAQELVLIRPSLVRRLVLASAAPQGAAGMHGWAQEVIAGVGKPTFNPEGYLGVFFAPSPASRDAGKQLLGRLAERTDDRDAPATWQTRQAQYDAVCAWGIPNHALLQRVSAIDVPVFVANGDSDPMTPALFLSARRPDPASAREDLPGFGARVPIPVQRRVRCRRRGIPQRRSLIKIARGEAYPTHARDPGD